MPRNDYISDNLVNMRDRLKQNYANPADAAPSAGSLSTPTVPQTDPVATQASGSVARNGRGDDLERTRRDLEGRLQRDLAAVSTELQLEITRRQELEKFLAVLNRVSGEVDSLREETVRDAEYARRLERLRIEYFQAAGRVSAFERHAEGRAGMGREELPPRTFGRLFFESLPLLIGMIVAALIVAAALLLSFL